MPTDKIDTASGVNYGSLDPFKRMCQDAARATAHVAPGEFGELYWSRGESVYLMSDPWGGVIGQVEEGLGTKNLVADACRSFLGRSCYDLIGQDTVAMIVNDMITVGVLPVSVAMHIAVGSDAWFDDKERAADLVHGWQLACMESGCTWGPGETPALAGVVVDGAALLSGSAWGYIKHVEDLLQPSKINEGSDIVFLESSGIHANGLTAARKIAAGLPEGYQTKLSDGRTYGETLLDPTHLYVAFMRRCYDQKMHEVMNYAVNITGHGWRKLMRAPQQLEYFIEELPTQLPIFDFIQKHSGKTDEEMYGSYNMGAGFAVFVDGGYADEILNIAKACGFNALHAGHVRQTGKRRVVIEPKNPVFEGETLNIR